MTLIPGDGVGPEIMDSTQEVLLQMGAKVDPLLITNGECSNLVLDSQIDFEEVYFSEVNRGASRLVFLDFRVDSKQNPPSSLEDVTALVKKNKVALRGVMGIPEVRNTLEGAEYNLLLLLSMAKEES